MNKQSCMVPNPESGKCRRVVEVDGRRVCSSDDKCDGSSFLDTDGVSCVSECPNPFFEIVEGEK